VTEEAGALATAIDRRGLDDQLDLRNIRFTVHHEVLLIIDLIEDDN